MKKRSSAVKQTEHVLKLLRSRPQDLTAMDALNEVVTMRLAAWVKELRDQGHVIESTMEKRNAKRFARYRL